MVQCCPLCPILQSCEFRIENISIEALYTSDQFAKSYLYYLSKKNKNKILDSNDIVGNKRNIIAERTYNVTNFTIIENSINVRCDNMDITDALNIGNKGNKVIIGNNSKVDRANISSPHANITDARNVAVHVEELKSLIEANDFKNKQKLLKEIETFSEEVNKPGSNNKALTQALKYISSIIENIPEIEKMAAPIVKTIFDMLR